jgi:hypothetical protein
VSAMGMAEQPAMAVARTASRDLIIAILRSPDARRGCG